MSKPKSSCMPRLTVLDTKRTCWHLSSRQRDKKERALQRKRERETRVTTKPTLFTVQDFLYDEANARCIRPAGHKLYRSGQYMLFNGYRVASFKAPKTACRGCHLRQQCLRHPDRTPHRQLTIIKHHEGPPPRRRSRCNDAAKRMRWKIDTPRGREIYSRRMVLRPFLGVMGTIEPVFANLQNKGMRRFTLRGQKKVSAQWQFFTMVHNIEKVAGVAIR